MTSLIVTCVIITAVVFVLFIYNTFEAINRGDTDDQRCYEGASVVSGLSFLMMLILLSYNGVEMDQMKANSVTKYGMIDKQKRYVGIDMSTNGKPPFPVESADKAKWWDKKEDRDNYLKDYYQLAPVKTTITVERE